MKVYYHVTLHDLEHFNDCTYWCFDSYIEAKKFFLDVHKEHPISCIELFAIFDRFQEPISIYP